MGNNLLTIYPQPIVSQLIVYQRYIISGIFYFVDIQGLNPSDFTINAKQICKT